MNGLNIEGETMGTPKVTPRQHTGGAGSRVRSSLDGEPSTCK